jgi:hypothetical protein
MSIGPPPPAPPPPPLDEELVVLLEVEVEVLVDVEVDVLVEVLVDVEVEVVEDVLVAVEVSEVEPLPFPPAPLEELELQAARTASESADETKTKRVRRIRKGYHARHARVNRRRIDRRRGALVEGGPFVHGNAPLRLRLALEEPLAWGRRPCIHVVHHWLHRLIFGTSASRRRELRDRSRRCSSVRVSRAPLASSGWRGTRSSRPQPWRRAALPSAWGARASCGRLAHASA